MPRKVLRRARRAPASIASLPRAWRPKPVTKPVVIDGAHAMELARDPEETARVAGLRHVDDEGRGIRRIGTGKSFRYLDPNGRALRDPDVLGRIRSLAIPPAWTDVWICPVDSGHIQATGRDARGRKQYRYHPRWRAVRDETKYHRMITFGEALPGIRARIEKDLALSGLPREKVLATVLRLLDTTLIRVGNEEYARDNKSFGLTTLQNRHVDVNGATLRFEFRGKSGVQHAVDVNDRRLAKIVRRCRELPGQDLFQYLGDDDERRPVTSSDVNDYLREVSGSEFTAKDFRTWHGTVLAAAALRASGPAEAESARKKNVVACIEQVWWRASSRWRSALGTRRRCAGSATCTRALSLRTSMDRCWSFRRRKKREGGSRRRADCATRKKRCSRFCEGERSDRARFAYFFFVRARVMMRTGVPSKPKRSRSWFAR